MAFVLPFIARPSRILATRLVSYSTIRPPTFYGRSFTSGSRSQATQSDEPLDSLTATRGDLLSKLAARPQALEAVKKLAEVLQKNGVDPTQQPSAMTLMKLAANTEIRTAATHLAEELRAADIEINPATAMEFMKALNNNPEGKS